jgi:hypothetical protein
MKSHIDSATSLFAIPFFFFALINSARSQVMNEAKSMTIYCTSNYDTTGNCTESQSGDDVKCTIIPGSFINCIDKKGVEYECLQIGIPIAYQSVFYCVKNKTNEINTNAYPDNQTIPKNKAYNELNEDTMKPNTINDNLFPEK